MKKVANYTFLKFLGNFFHVQHLEKLHELHNNLPFFPEKMKIEKFEKLITNLHDKTEYVIHIRNLKRVLNHGLVF